MIRLAGLLMLLLWPVQARAPHHLSVVNFKPVIFDRFKPERRSFQDLRLLGAWELSSDNDHFHGISAMRVAGGRIVAISDTGYLFAFPFNGSQRRSLLQAASLPQGYHDGKPDRDAESMAVDPASGRIWVGYEGSNRIRSFVPGREDSAVTAAPPAMAAWPSNRGAEAMVRLKDGRFLVLGEGALGPKSVMGLLFAGDPAAEGQSPTRFFFSVPQAYSPTDVAELPDGDILILSRNFSWLGGFSAGLTTIDPQRIAPDRVLWRKRIMRLKPPLNIDNMEALSVEQRGDRTIVWMASDDNHNPFQKTLLLKFAWEPVAWAGNSAPARVIPDDS